MTQFLPPNLLALFQARDAIPFLPPTDKLTYEKKRQPYTGIADYLDHFEDPEETPEPVKPETKLQKLERKRREKAEQNAYKLEQDLAMWNPNDNQESTADAYRTLFVSRINYDTSESKLKREFEVYGKIKQIKMIHDVNTGKPRGYAFIEYEEEADMHAAYKRADGKKIDGKRVLVDIERGRTIKGWKPRRLGGGKGGRKSHYVEAPSGIENSGRGGSLEAENDDSRNILRSNRDKDRKKSKERSRSRDRDRKRRSKSKDRHRSRSKDRANKKSRRSSRSRSKDRLANSGSAKKQRSRSKERSKKDDFSNGSSMKKEKMDSDMSREGVATY